MMFSPDATLTRPALRTQWDVTMEMRFNGTVFVAKVAQFFEAMQLGAQGRYLIGVVRSTDRRTFSDLEVDLKTLISKVDNPK